MSDAVSPAPPAAAPVAERDDEIKVGGTDESTCEKCGETWMPSVEVHECFTKKRHDDEMRERIRRTLNPVPAAAWQVVDRDQKVCRTLDNYDGGESEATACAALFAGYKQPVDVLIHGVPQSRTAPYSVVPLVRQGVEQKVAAWLLTNQDGGQRVVLGADRGTPMADEEAVPLVRGTEAK